MKIYAMTKKGVCKRENEDRILVNDSVISEGYFEFDASKIVVAIADGVGGNNTGAVAASFVCEYLSKIENVNRQVLENINIKLIEESNKDIFVNNIATTLSGINISGGKSKLFHIGNTRINILQGNYLKQLTEDHTTVNWLVKTRKLTTVEAEKYNKRNEITACLGGGDINLMRQLLFIENCNEITNANKIIMTSDGIHDYVSIDELENFLSEIISIKEICKAIIEKAAQNGSKDDRSIFIIEKEV